MAEIIEKVYALLEPLLDGTDIFLVNIKVKPVNNLKVFLDADSGLSIEKCAMVNRKLYARMEEQLFPDGDFSLEVSSPGVDEPLVQMRQYRKNIGRKVTITDNEGNDKTGMLKAVTDDEITLEIKPVKQKEIRAAEKSGVAVTELQIPLNQIKKTVVQIIF